MREKNAAFGQLKKRGTIGGVNEIGAHPVPDDQDNMAYRISCLRELQ